MTAKSGHIRIGIGGWTFEPWRGVFYPMGLAHKRELEFASRQVSSIEINGSFYSLQTPKSYRTWYEQTPDGVNLIATRAMLERTVSEFLEAKASATPRKQTEPTAAERPTA